MGSQAVRSQDPAGVRRGRRQVGRVAVAALAALGFGLSTSPVSAQDSAEGILPEGDWTEEQIAYAVDLVERTEEVLPQFDVGDTIEELDAGLSELGYVHFGPAPDGYHHFTNRDLLFDDKILDPAAPESLVYHEDASGQFELVSAMFTLNFGDTMEDIPEDLRWLPGWHTHPGLCANPDGGFGGLEDENGNCPEGTVPIDIPMMHVWIVDNECGHRFAGIDAPGAICEAHPPGGHEDPPGGHEDPPDDHDDGDHDDMDHDDGMEEAPPAQPVTGVPSFTG